MQVDDVGVAGERRPNHGGKDVPHRGHQLETFDKNVMREVDKEWDNEWCMKLDCSECEEVVNG